MPHEIVHQHHHIGVSHFYYRKKLVSLEIKYYDHSMVALALDPQEAIQLGKYLLEYGMNARDRNDEMEAEDGNSKTRTTD
jgi:hypothetical protein